MDMSEGNLEYRLEADLPQSIRIWPVHLEAGLAEAEFLRSSAQRSYLK